MGKIHLTGPKWDGEDEEIDFMLESMEDDEDTHNSLAINKQHENETRTLLLEWIAEMVSEGEFESARNASHALKDPEKMREITANLRVENETYDDGQGRWITASGVHIFVKEGQTTDEAFHEHVAKHAGENIAKEGTVPPPPGQAYRPNVEAKDKDGITLAARIGVPAMMVPPPPNIPRLPNLTPRERAVEHAFIDYYQKDPDGVAAKFREDAIMMGKEKGEPPTFGTDDAKIMSHAWSSTDLKEQSENRATLNCALHQTANAICKRAFLQHLDSLSPEDKVMVTVGGCGAGKGFSLKNNPEALALKKSSQAVWDSAGDQNATENKWIQAECDKRGLKATYVYVHADPKEKWTNTDMGVVKRASDPKDGRMVDAQVFADSYALGARNHDAFHKANIDNPNAKFIFLTNPPGPPLDRVPKEALHIDRHELAKFARETVQSSNAPDHVKRGGLIGGRIFKENP